MTAPCQHNARDFTGLIDTSVRPGLAATLVAKGGCKKRARGAESGFASTGGIERRRLSGTASLLVRDGSVPLALVTWPVELGDEIAVDGHVWPLEVVDLVWAPAGLGSRR